MSSVLLSVHSPYRPKVQGHTIRNSHKRRKCQDEEEWNRISGDWGHIYCRFRTAI